MAEARRGKEKEAAEKERHDRDARTKVRSALRRGPPHPGGVLLPCSASFRNAMRHVRRRSQAEELQRREREEAQEADRQQRRERAGMERGNERGREGDRRERDG